MVESTGQSSNNQSQDYDWGTINLEQLVHLKAYQTGYLTWDKRFTSVPGNIYGSKRKISMYEHESSFLPFDFIDKSRYGRGAEFLGLPRDFLDKNRPAKPVDDGSIYDEKLEEGISALKETIQSNTMPIQVEQVDLREKPVAVIYNPSSGRGKNIRQLIETKLAENGIKCTFYETLRYMHAWELAGGEIDFSQHSALVPVGGDGTLHEVINGMLMRKDGHKLPVAPIPNGSGNDLVGCIGIQNVEQAIAWLTKGDVIKMDVNKCLLDYEHEDDIPEDEDRNSKFRYSVINAAVGYIAHTVHKSVAHKPIFGSACYLTAGLAGLLFNDLERFEITIEQHDGSKISLAEDSLCLVIMNGKYGGGRLPFCPAASLNDGLQDILLQYAQGSKLVLMSIIKGLKSEGKHLYDDGIAYFRGYRTRITLPRLYEAGMEDAGKSQEELRAEFRAAHPEIEPSKFQVDGEALLFDDFVTIETVPQAVDLIVDYQEMMQQRGILKSQ